MERIDKYGHCVQCSKMLMQERVVDGKNTMMFTPDYGTTEFLLNDGSRMRVCMCKKCQETVNLSDINVQKGIMDAVKRGWQLEVSALVADSGRPEWTKERGDSHMEEYGRKEVDCHCENLADHAIAERKKRIEGLKCL